MLTGRNWVKVFLVFLILNGILNPYPVNPIVLMDTNTKFSVTKRTYCLILKLY